MALEQAKGAPVSGEKLAGELGCTRAAVWKAIRALQAEGHEIEGVNNRGYTLRRSADVLNEHYIQRRLDESGIPLTVRCEQTLDSTNNELKRLASAGERRDLCIVCAEQTGGRGRQGRSFFSPKDSGVYFSLLLHPKVSPQTAARLTTLAATAEALALDHVLAEIAAEEGSGLPEPALIKWINDVCLRGKKITGILTESQLQMEDLSLEYVIVGIGLNLYEPAGGFPAEIADVAGAVFPDGRQRENLKNRIVAEILVRFMEYYRDFPDCDYLDDYKRKCFVLGQDITILTADHTPREGGPDRSHARALDIDREAHLLVEYADGTREYLSGGEVSVRMKD